MKNSTLIETTPEEIAKIVCDMLALREQEQKTSTKKDDELLSREQTLELLQIDASTLWRYQNKGRITVYKFGTKCYYKKNEIIDSLIPLKK